MCIRDRNIGDGFNSFSINLNRKLNYGKENVITVGVNNDYGKYKVPFGNSFDWPNDGGICLLYTSDAADERSSVDLGGRRIIKKKTKAKEDHVRSTHKVSGKSREVNGDIMNEDIHSRRSI